MPKVSDAHKAAVRNRLLDAAASCLREKGYAATRTRDILAEAGLSAGALYTYFRSKDELLLALAEREQGETFRTMLSSAPAQAQAHRDPADLLMDLLDAVLNGDPGDEVLRQMRARAAHDEVFAVPMHQHDVRVLAAVTPLAEAAQAEGFLAADVDAAALMELVAILYDALAARGAAGGYVTSVERVAATARRVLTLGAVAGDEAFREAARRRLSGTP